MNNLRQYLKISLSPFLLMQLFILIIWQNAYSQAPPIQMQRCLGGQGTEGGSSMVVTADGGYVVAGNAESLGYGSLGDVATTKDGGADLWVVKINNVGVLQWQIVLGGFQYEGAGCIRQTLDGGFIVCGYTFSVSGDVIGMHGDHPTFSNTSDMWVIKLSSTGVLQWQRCLGGFKNDFGFAVETLSDGNFMAVGWTESTDGDITINKGKKDAFFVKLSGEGNTIWTRSLGGSEDDYAWSVKATSNGGCVVIGNSNSSNGDFVTPNGILGQWVIKINSQGIIEWKRNSFGATYSIELTNDGGYVLAGAKSRTGQLAADMWLAKVNSTGELEWEKYYGGSKYDVATCVKACADGGYYVGGYTYSNDGDVTEYHGGENGYTDLWIIKVSSSGALEWQKCLGGSEQDMASNLLGVYAYKGDIQIGLDGGVVVVGHTFSSDGDVVGNHTGGNYTIDDADMWVIKFSPESSIQHFHQLLTNSSFIQRTLLSVIPGSNSFKVCADGSQASVFKFAGGGINYSQVTVSVPDDLTRYGAFSLISQNADSLVVRYKHPTQIESTAAFFTLTATLTIPGSQPKQFFIEVNRAPVIMVHGLWSDKESFLSLENSLIQSGIYTKDFLRRVDYSLYNNLHFAANSSVVPSAINEVINQLEDNKISAGAVDIVGHSMGGLLSRLYLQSLTYRNDIHKLITVNTPHSGSQIANFLKDISNQKANDAFCGSTLQGLFSNNTMCDGGAVDDLRVNSAAIDSDLNGGANLNRNKVPSHTITTVEYATADEVIVSALKLMDRTISIGWILDAFGSYRTGLIFYPEMENDLIVSLLSQKGGMVGTCTSYFTNQLHMGSPANLQVIEKIKLLLGASPTENSFCLGFNPVDLNYNPQDRPSIVQPQVKAQIATSLSITSPAKGSYYRPSDTVPISVTSIGISEIRTIVRYNYDSIYVAKDTTSAVSYTAQAGPYPGIRQVIAIGKTFSGESLADTSYFIVTPNLCQSTQTGDWEDIASWTCGHIPTVGDIVVINQNHQITISSTYAEAQKIVYNGGQIRFVDINSKLFIKGTTGSQ